MLDIIFAKFSTPIVVKEKYFMEEKNKSIIKEKVKKSKRKFIIMLVFILIIISGILIDVFDITSKEGKITTNVKSSLEKIAEKSDLETVNFTYNVIAKKCKDEENCDIESNKMSNFKYVVSCKGKITAGLDFKEITIDVDKKNKKIVITLPETSITSEPSISSIQFINGDELPADILPEARKLCQETIKNKSNEDEQLLQTAKNQAEEVLEEYYKQWIKSYNSSYEIEFK
jgi:hypothetical protein